MYPILAYYKCTECLEYVKYTDAYADNPVTAATFYRCRPRNVKSKVRVKYVGCLCEYCENLQLKIEAINCIKPGTFKETYELPHSTMCPKPTGWAYHRPECIEQTCDTCGVNLLDIKLASLLDDTSGIVELVGNGRNHAPVTQTRLQNR